MHRTRFRKSLNLFAGSISTAMARADFTEARGALAEVWACNMSAREGL